MRRASVFPLIALICAAPSPAQQPAPATAPPIAATNSTAAQTVYYAGPGVTAPQLLPLAVSVSLPDPCNQLNGMVRLSATVDSTGAPHNVAVIRADDPLLGSFAVSLLSDGHFKPGTSTAPPAAVAIELTVGLETCAVQVKKGKDRGQYTLMLHAHPLIALNLTPPPAADAGSSVSAGDALPSADSIGKPLQVGGPIGAPVPIYQPDPEYSAAAIQKKVRGTCLIAATVDVNGFPRSLHVVKSLDPALDRNAVESVRTWRFWPALKDRSLAVPVEITIAASFQAYKNVPYTFAAMIAESPDAVLASFAPDAGDHIAAPLPLNMNEIDPEYSYYGRMNRISGVCIVALLVNADGVPQNVHVIKGLERGMDEDAVAAVQQLRFKPALKDGATPVPAEVIMPISFHFRVKLTKQQLFEELLPIIVYGWIL